MTVRSAEPTFAMAKFPGLTDRMPLIQPCAALHTALREHPLLTAEVRAKACFTAGWPKWHAKDSRWFINIDRDSDRVGLALFLYPDGRVSMRGYDRCGEPVVREDAGPFPESDRPDTLKGHVDAAFDHVFANWVDTMVRHLAEVA